MNDDVFSFMTGIGIGAAIGSAAMYVLDPEVGQRRRALAADKVTEAQRKTKNAVGVTARDLRNRTAGTIAEVRSRISEGDVTDEVLEGRVRSKLGFLVRHPSAITTHVSEGCVFLGGAVLSDEVQQLLDGVRTVRGVAAVEDQLEVHDSPEGIPGLQGDRPKPAGEVWDVMQRRWSPSTRFLVGTAGAVSLGLIAYSLSSGERASSTPGQQRHWRTGKRGDEETTTGWGI
jgi:gas vesicle protein